MREKENGSNVQIFDLSNNNSNSNELQKKIDCLFSFKKTRHIDIVNC